MRFKTLKHKIKKDTFGLIYKGQVEECPVPLLFHNGWTINHFKGLDVKYYVLVDVDLSFPLDKKA